MELHRRSKKKDCHCRYNTKKVNLHPNFRRPFSTWLEEKRSVLEGGMSFKLEDFSTDIYPLLSPLWHRMIPVDKRLIVSIADRNGGCYTMKFLRELYLEGHVMYADMQKLRI